MRAGLTPDVQAALTADPSLVSKIAISILEEHFPESYHEDLLDAVGLVVQTAASLKKRDPMFRHRVLKAYEYRSHENLLLNVSVMLN